MAIGGFGISQMLKQVQHDSAFNLIIPVSGLVYISLTPTGLIKSQKCLPFFAFQLKFCPRSFFEVNFTVIIYLGEIPKEKSEK